MSRITKSDLNSGPTVGTDYAVGTDVSHAVESAARAPDLSGLFRSNQTYSDQKLERLARRFGLPFNYLGQPDVDTFACLVRSAELVQEHKFVSAKRVLEMGLNEAVPKGQWEGNEVWMLREFVKILEDFILVDNEILDIGNGFDSNSFPRDIWSLGLDDSHERAALDREFHSYGWEVELETLKVRMQQILSQNEWIAPLFESASALSDALTSAIDRDIAVARDI